MASTLFPTNLLLSLYIRGKSKRRVYRVGLMCTYATPCSTHAQGGVHVRYTLNSLPAWLKPDLDRMIPALLDGDHLSVGEPPQGAVLREAVDSQLG
jgi:hypothetical protein